MAYRLFLSHSSSSEEASTERLHAIAAAIEAAAANSYPIRVLYDKEQITGGDDWRRRIAFMLHVCHGGVVLLDEQALASPWVHAEATVLSLRHSYGDKFAFIPVSFLDEPDFEKARRARAAQREAFATTSWKVVDLPGIQFVRGRNPAEVAAGIVQALHDGGFLATSQTPAARLAGQLAPQLEQASQDALQDLVDDLCARAGYLAEDPVNLAALALVEAMLRSECLADTRNLLKPLGTAFPNEKRYRILAELAPLAMAADAAAMLCRRRGGGGFSHASLCAERPDHTVPRYIRRAHLAQEPPLHFAIPNTHGDFEEFCASLRDGWRSHHGSPEAFALADEDVDELLADGDDCYVWIDGPVDEDVLLRLDAVYPRVALLVHQPASAAPHELPHQLLAITPTLTPADERRIHLDYVKATAALGGAR